jgi:hypothetical protein
VALPVEHGGWGFLLEPVALGLILAPTSAGVCLGLAALAAFLIRHPLKLVLMDRRRGAWHPRTGLAVRFALGYAVLALVLVSAAWLLSPASFWPAIVLGAPAALVALGYDARGRSRDALPEAAGAVALGASVTAIALAGGLAREVAYGAWALLALRGVPAVLFVRSRLRLDRGLPAGIPVTLGCHALAVAGGWGLAHFGWGPWLAALALLLLLARAAYGLSRLRPELRPKQLGFRELGWGLVTLLLLAAGYRLGL